VEDVKLCVMAAGNTHWLPEKDIVKIFMRGLNPEILREKIYSHSFETLVEVMAKKGMNYAIIVI